MRSQVLILLQDGTLKVFSITELCQEHSVTLGDLALSCVAIESEGKV